MREICVVRRSGGVLLALTALVSFSACGQPSEAGAGVAESERPGTIECLEDDMGASFSIEFDGPAQTRPDSPREALAEFFSNLKAYESVDASEWSENEERSTDEAVVMEVERDGQLVGEASVASTEGSWIVQSLSVCQSYVDESAT